MADDTEQPVLVRFECDVDLEVDWQVAGFRYSEAFNEPFELVVELYTTSLWAEPAQLLGANATVTIERGVLARDIAGIVERIADGAIQQGRLVTQLTIVPALRALGMRKTSRIFQDMTIVEILQAVLDEGLGPYERSVDSGYLSGSYDAQEYTVQYQETDLQFVHRLMEEYGISYRFKTEDGKDVMLLGDSEGAWVDLVSLGNEAAVLPVNLRDGGSGGREDVRKFQRVSKLRSTVQRTMVFDWMAPTSLIQTEGSEKADVVIPNGAELAPEREDYDHGEPSTTYGYRTGGLVMAALDKQVALRRALHQRDAVTCRGTSSATQLAPGCKFELLDHPQPDLAAEYLVTEVVHSYGSFAGGEPGTDAYTNQFECIPSAVEWRPQRRHPRPRIASVQTATVVGPAGEEIYTDEHGRIKVQFHWDRDGTFDENSSCFVRVVQPWAGNGWGFVWLPRINMEVIVTFVDGDVDRPVVTGCLYNGANATPYPLPDDKTKSTIKSNSSPGGGGFNELRFEDAAGSEEIFVHAQKDYNEVVLNNHTTKVDVDQTNTVGGNQTQSVSGNQTESVGGEQTMSVEKNRTVTITGSQSVTIKGSKAADGVNGSKLNITGDYKVDASNTIAIQAPTEIKLTCGGSSITMVPGTITLQAGGGAKLVLDGNALLQSAAGTKVLLDANALTQSSGGSKVLLDANALAQASGGAKVLLDANALTQSSGGSKVLLDGNALMNSPGTATVSAPTSTLAGGGGSVEAGGAGVTCAGGKVDVSGGMVNISGGMVKIN
jgi:type VI secretion system secreted protein VgrG